MPAALLLGLVWALASHLAAPAQGQTYGSASTDAERIADLERALKTMEARLEYLESRLEEKNGAALVASTGALPLAAMGRSPSSAMASPPIAPQAPAQPTGPVVAAGPDGFNIRGAEGDFRLNIRYQMQVDSRFAADRSTGEPDSIFLRRAQPIISATLFRRFEVIGLTDFADGRARINDAYIDFVFTNWIRLRGGKFKMPVGLERLRSGMALSLAERSLATQLVPNRDIGLQVWSDLPGGKVSYAAGVFNGVADAATGDGDSDDDKEFAGRIFTHPFAGSDSLLSGLGLGIGGSRGPTRGLPVYSTMGETTFFLYSLDARADGMRYRIDPQAYYFNGPVGLLGEYVLSSQEVRNNETGIVYSPKNTGFQVQGTLFLTGDRATYAASSPTENFEPANGTFGAFELAARYSELRVDRGVFEQGIGAGIAQKAKAWALGLNWYMNRSVRLMFNYEKTDFLERPGGETVPHEKVFLQRLQLKF
jgi:phosphate-selective porin OprO/OprP